jgi:hypothetical protein
MSSPSRPLVLSAHAIQRYQERVDRAASTSEARLALVQITSLRDEDLQWCARDPQEAGRLADATHWAPMLTHTLDPFTLPEAPR